MHEQLQQFIDKLGLEYHAEFIPTKQPANTVKHPQLHWNVTLKRGGRQMTVNYREGCAHVVGYQQFHKTLYDKQQHDYLIRKTCETGKLYKYTRLSFGPIASNKTQPAPKLIDVLYCLVMDADILDRGSFEEWASDYGYDTDSRSAEKTYRECLEQSLRLRNLIGDNNIEQLRELYQGY